MAALFGAQDVAGAADFHIAEGNLQPGAELGRFLNRVESGLGDLAQRLDRLVQQDRRRRDAIARPTRPRNW